MSDFKGNSVSKSECEENKPSRDEKGGTNGH